MMLAHGANCLGSEEVRPHCRIFFEHAGRADRLAYKGSLTDLIRVPW